MDQTDNNVAKHDRLSSFDQSLGDGLLDESIVLKRKSQNTIMGDTHIKVNDQDIEQKPNKNSKPLNNLQAQFVPPPDFEDDNRSEAFIEVDPLKYDEGIIMD